jgi:FRG domain
MTNVTKFDSATEFLSTIRRSNGRWWSNGKCNWIFRGQGDSRWKLLPAAWRQRNDAFGNALSYLIRNPYPQWEQELFGDRKFFTREQTVVAAATTFLEWHLINDFEQRCRRIGIPLQTLIKDEHRSPWEAITAMCVNDGGEKYFCGSYMSLVAVAQHHGVPTRLMDWTDDPIHAAHFAVHSIPEDSPAIAFFAVDVEASLQFNGSKIPGHGEGYPSIHVRVSRPSREQSPNMLSQKAALTGLNFNFGWRPPSTGVWHDLETVFDAEPKATGVDWLHKFELPRAEVGTLKSLIERENVDMSVLMPSIDSAAKRSVECLWGLGKPTPELLAAITW